ncbi:MAG: hypothetical protein P4L33_20545 [Capsulimonadaceae bacterium]|nr:hypothetical protein [Capsulimonadaceae bacterium]
MLETAIFQSNSSTNNIQQNVKPILTATILGYEGNALASRVDAPYDEYGRAILVHDQAVWRASVSQTSSSAGMYELSCEFTLLSGSEGAAAVGIVFSEENWSADSYLLLPGAAYDGNRFDVRAQDYPPMFVHSDFREDLPTTISDVPRLNNRSGQSRLQILARDMTTPALAYYLPAERSCVIILTDERTDRGPVGVTITETDDRSGMQFAVSSPGVREKVRYAGTRIAKPSEDRGAAFTEGDSLILRAKLHVLPCDDVPGLFRAYCSKRKDLTGNSELVHELPFSKAWQILEDKYNRDNWNPDGGYYSVGMRESIPQDWQVGWVGGLMATHPLLLLGAPESRERAMANFDWFFAGGQALPEGAHAPGGLFYGAGHLGKWYGDNIKNKADRDFHLIRKSSDGLYFLCKQFDLLEKQGRPIKSEWREGAMRLADAFAAIWTRHGQFGQFVNNRTLDVIVGGSTSASTAPAGLALASDLFGCDEYLRVAEASAKAFFHNATEHGVTTGGPGEALQCPDSESAYGLLESYIVLWEITGNALWLDRAKFAAYQCATWNVSYDYAFPLDSLFGRLGLHSAGAVMANVQNKHAAPGICTLSGDSLFKLWRATGDSFFIDVVRETAHNITQYLSREDRPVGDMPSGWMNERVNLSDWDNNIGGIFHGSTWAEVACMLTCAEIPGLYVRSDTGTAIAFDHVNAEVLECTPKGAIVRIENPTLFTASVSVLSETSEEACHPLRQNRLWNAPRIVLESGETKLVTFA